MKGEGAQGTDGGLATDGRREPGAGDILVALVGGSAGGWSVCTYFLYGG